MAIAELVLQVPRIRDSDSETSGDLIGAAPAQLASNMARNTRIIVSDCLMVFPLSCRAKSRRLQ